jgi:hypothetical protein
VNLGVALACPELNWFGYRLETRQADRIMDFFPELKFNKDVFAEGRKLFKQELDRVAKMMNDADGDKQLRFKENAHLFNQVFLNLVRPREEVFGFSNPQTCLTDDPKVELLKLFGCYVERRFAQRPEYQEQLMTRRLKTVFSAQKIVDFTEHTFVNDLCHVYFPFVREVEGRYLRAIHPLDLNKTDTPKIVEHADRWKNKLQRLKDIHGHPENILLVVRQPNTGKQLDVCQQMCKELTEVGALLIPQEDKTEILHFAQPA